MKHRSRILARIHRWYDRKRNIRLTRKTTVTGKGQIYFINLYLTEGR